MDSLDNQIEDAIQAVEQLGFDLTEKFVDEGKTGTTSTRKAYLKMLTAIEEQRIDVIVTKSLDRMNRNILDFYLFLDLVLKNNIKLYFYLDRSYYKPDDKIVIGIKAILAEEFSRDLSKKLCNAHAKRQERGEVMMLNSLTYGYRKEMQPNGKRKIIIDESEAEMIRLIFDYSIEGWGARKIGKKLYEKGYRNRNGNEIGEGSIRRIIRNPLVMGTMIMNRVRFDFNTKTTIYTSPEQWIWKDGAVPPIISQEDWKAANEKMDTRLKIKRTDNTAVKQGVNAGNYAFSGKIICGICGRPYYQTRRNNKSSQIIQWKCSTYMKFGRSNPELFKSNVKQQELDIGVGCDGANMEEDLLIKILDDMAKEHASDTLDKKVLIDDAMKILSGILGQSGDETKENDLHKQITLIIKRQETLLEKYIDGKIADDIYMAMDNKLRKERDQLEAELNKIESNRSMASGIEKRLKQIEETLRNGGIEQATAYSMLDSIEKIVIYQEHLEIILDSMQMLGISNYDILGDRQKQCIKVPLSNYQLRHTNIAIERSKARICELIAENPQISIEKMAEVLGLGKRSAYARVDALKKEGRIKVTGKGPASRWFVLD